MAPKSKDFYPTNRDILLKTSESWMNGKRLDDNLGPGLWRVHDGLYDLRDFAARHPGGKFWIEATEGTDITEAFESGHVIADSRAELLLKKYFVRAAIEPRRSDFTFEENGFYKTLKKRVGPILKQVGTGPTLSSLVMQDCLSLSSMMVMALGSFYDSTLTVFIAGILLGMSTSGAHNYFHQRDTWRRFMWDLSLLTSRDWRISHAISHHLFPNTINDFEVSGLEPFLYFLPNTNKNRLIQWLSYFVLLIITFLVGHIELFKRFVAVVILRQQKLHPENLLPVVELIIMWSLSPVTFGRSLWLWSLLHASAALWFVSTAVTASHHHPLIYHEGDEPRANRDWGLHQIDTTRDVIGKSDNFFLVATTFGNHTLHHLFPTIDHTKLHHLYPALIQTCEEFGVEFKPRSYTDMFKGTFQQLVRNFSTPCSIENGRLPVGRNKRD